MAITGEKALDGLLEDRSLEQLINISTLPGIQEAAIAMPDIHQGYGFPIGGLQPQPIGREPYHRPV